MLLRILDIFFVVFHTTLVVFNITGWIWRKTRLLNLICLSITGASWVIIGWAVGTLGYCPLTDWHFSLLVKMGKTGLPSSYMKYLIDRITGLDINPVLVDNLTLILFITALLLSFLLNLKDRKWINSVIGD